MQQFAPAPIGRRIAARIASCRQLLAPPPLLSALVECACVPIRDVLCDSALDEGSDDRIKPLCDMLKTVSTPDAPRIATTLRLSGWP